MSNLQRPLSRVLVTAGVICMHLVAVTQPYAATADWTANSGTNFNWGDGDNWSLGSVPTLDDDAVFPFLQPNPGTLSGPGGITLASGSLANRLWIQGDYALSGGTLALGSGGIQVNRASMLVLDSQLTGSNGLTLSGGGTLKLTNAGNNYTGATTLANGTLIISNPAQLGTDTSMVVVTGSASRGFMGGNLLLDGSGGGMTFTRDLSLQGYGPITDRTAALSSLGYNTVSGDIQFGAGNVSTAITSTAGILTLSGDLTSLGTGQLRFGLTNSTGVGSFHLTGALTGAMNIEKLGGGTLILNSSNASGFSGNLLLAGGSVRVAHGSELGTGTANGAITFGAGGATGTLEVRTDFADSFATRRAQMNTSGSSVLFLDHAVGGDALNETVTFAGLTLTASSSTRTLTINSRNGYGVLFAGDSVGGNLGGSNNITVNATGKVTFDGDFWNNTSTTARTLTMTVGTGAETQISGSLVASGADHVLTKAGNGNLTLLGGSSTYSGATNINAGSLTVSHGGSITNNTAAVNLGATTTTGTLNFIGENLTTGEATVNKAFNLAGTTGGGAILANQTGTSAPLIITGGIAAGGVGSKVLTLGGSNSLDNEIRGAIANNSGSNLTSLYKTGTGTWVLSGANTYTGSTLINNGILKIQDTYSGSSRNVLADNATVGLGFALGAVTDGSAGGVFHYSGAIGGTSVENIGNLITGSGAGTIRVTAGAGGTATLNIASMNVMPTGVTVATAIGSTSTATVTVSSTAGLVPGMRVLGGSATAYIVSIINGTQMVLSANQANLGVGAALTFERLPGSSTVNFAPGAGSTVSLGGIAAVGLLNGYSYFNGANFAYAENIGTAVLRAPIYSGPMADAGFVQAVTTLTADSHNLVDGGNVTSGVMTIRSLKLNGSGNPTLSLSGALTINSAGTGGILVTGGSATITGGSITAGAGGGDLVIRVDGATDVLNLFSPVASSTTGGLTKTGAGTLVIGGVNAHTTGGATNLLEGTIQLAPGGVLSANSVNFFMRQGTVLDLNGLSTSTGATSASIGAFNGTGTVTNTSASPVVFAVGSGSSGGTGTFNGSINEVAGQISVIKLGTSNTMTWTGISNYTGSTTIGASTATSGALQVSYLANIGEVSSIGRGDATSTATNAASLVFGTTTGGLIYAGSASVSTDRLFTLAGTSSTAGATITNNGINNAALVFSNTNAIAFTGTANQLLRLSGTSLSDNWFHPQIVDNVAGSAVTSLTKVSTGLWILGNANNSYTGLTTIGDGILQAQDGSTLPTASGLILGSVDKTTIFQSSGLFTRNLATEANAGPNTVSWSAGITTGAAGFAASTGNLVVAIGGLENPTTLVWGQGGFVPAGTGSGARLTFNSTTSLAEVDFRNAVDLNGANRTITVADNTSTFTDYATMSGVISNSTGTAGITKNGNGTLQLLGANTYNGVTAVTGGMLLVNSLGNSATPGPSSLGDSTNGHTAAGALTLGNASTTAGILQYVGAGEVSDRMIRLNTTTGSTQIHADGTGALVLTNVRNDMAAGAKSLYLRGSNAFANMITSDLGNNGGNLGIIVDGGATWILSGNNTYSGTTTLSAGSLGIGGSSVFGNGTLILSNGNLFGYGADRIILNTVNQSNNSAMAFTGDHSIAFAETYVHLASANNNAITNNIVSGKTLTFEDVTANDMTAIRAWTINGAGHTIINGDITTTTAFGLNLSYSGNGILTLNGVNTTGGSTTIGNAAGTVIIARDDVFGTGTLALTTGTLQSAGGDRVIANNVTHGGTFIIGGADKMTFTGTWLNNAASRTLTVNTPGGVVLAGEVRLSESATSARTLTFNGTGDVLISGTVSNGGGTGASALAYTGSGMLTLTAANTYTGTTTLNNVNGVLRLNGSGKVGAGNLTVNAGLLEIMATGVDQTVVNLTLGSTTSTYSEISIGAGRTLTPTGDVIYTASNTTTATPNGAVISGAGTLHLGTGGILVTIGDNLSADVDMAWEMGRLTGSGILSKAGNGTLDIRDIEVNDFTGSYEVTAGAILGLGLSTGNNLVLNGGVFEGSGTFTRSLGTGDNQVQWAAGSAGGGFAAFGSDLTVTLGGVTGPIVWGGLGGTPFFASETAPLIFGSASANRVVNFTHSLDLNGGNRTINVVNNTTSTEDRALLSGNLFNGSLTKTGNGELQLSGNNTFTGPLAINGSGGSLLFTTPENLGGATTSVSLQAGFLSFVGSSDLTVNNAININPATEGQNIGLQNLGANGSNGAVVTFAGPINTGANILTLTGTGAGIVTGGITQTGTAADVYVTSGNWTIRGSNLIGDDLVVQGPTAVLNLDGTGIISHNATTSSGLYGRNGSIINLLANNPFVEPAGLDFIYLGDTSGTLPGTLNMNSFNLTTPRLDLGQIPTDQTGIILGTGTLTVSATLNLYRGRIEANLVSTVTNSKSSQGEVVLAGNNSGLTGGTSLINGTLRLDYTSLNNRKVGSGTFNAYGGTLILDGNAGAATVETVGNLNVGGGSNAGASTLIVNPGAGQQATLNFGSITRTTAGGTVDFNLPSGAFITTTSSNPANLTSLGGWATFGDSSFATVTGNLIVALTSTAKDNVATWLASDNVTDANGYFGTLTGGSVNSIIFDSAGPSALTIAGGARFTVNSGGILITENAGSGSITGGILTSNLAISTSSLRDLVIHQHSQNSFTLSSSLEGFLAVTKSGEGTLIMNGYNTATGQTSINEGTLSISGGNAIGDRSIVNVKNRPGVILDLNNSAETFVSLVGGGADGGLVDVGTGTLHLANSTATAVYGGLIQGSGTLIKSGVSTQELEGNNTGFTGHVIINGGLMHLDSTNGALSNAARVTLNGGEIMSDQEQSGSRDRIGNNAIVTLNNTAGTRGLWLRNENQTSNRADTVGTVVLGAGNNVIQATTNAATTSATNSGKVGTLTITNLLRENHATVLVRGQGLGSGAGERGRIAPATQPAGSVGGGGAAGSATITIVPYMIGASGGLMTTGSVTHMVTDAVLALQLGNSFVTWVSATEGLRPLDLNSEYTLNASGYNALSGITGNNVRFAVNPSAPLTGGSKTINSLVLDSSDGELTLTGGAADTLTLASGALLATTTTGANEMVIEGFAELRTNTDEYLMYVTHADSSLSIASALTSDAALVKSGAGSLILTGANTYNGGTWFNQGLIEISALNFLGTGGLNFHGGGLRWATGSSFDPTTRALTLGIGGGIFDTNGNDVVFANAFGNGGAGGLTKAGLGNLTLNAVGNFTGPAVISGGTLTYGTPTALPITTALTLSGGTLDIASFDTTLGGLNVVTNSTITGNADLLFTQDVTVSNLATTTLTINNVGTTTFDGDLMVLVNLGTDARTLTIAPGADTTVVVNSQIVDGNTTGNLTKTGNGTLTLNAANYYNGTTTVTTGALRLAHDLALGTITGATSISGESNTGVLELTNNITVTGEILSLGARQGAGINNTHIRNVSGNNEWAGSINFTTGGSTYNIESADGLFTISGQISGAATTGGRSLRFTGEGDGSVTGPIVNGTSTANINITKVGGGTWAFSGVNTYTGGTVVSEGRLLVNNATGSGTGTGSVTVATGATLGGMGSLSGAVTLTGILSPGTVDLSGNSVAGQLTVGTLTANTGSTLFFQVGGASIIDPDAVTAYQANPGSFVVPASWTSSYEAGVTGHDQINITGSSVQTINTTVTISGDYLNGYTPGYGDVFHFVDWASLGTNDLGGDQNFLNLPVISGGSWNTEYFSSHGIVFVVPEPSRMLLMFLGLLAFFIRRRR